MQFRGRAYYNLLQMGFEPSSDRVLPWQVENYRELTDRELFNSLRRIGLDLDKDSFLELTDQVDSPEAFAEELFKSESEEERLERKYLVIFELWRRYCKEKESLSIFCDELDFLINKFYEEDGSCSEDLDERVTQLEDILDTCVDEGEESQSIFKTITTYFANNLEEFIYNYAAALLNEGSDLTASEIVDGFYEYVENKLWFDFLKTRLIALTNGEEAEQRLSLLLEQLHENPDLDLLYEVLRFLVHFEDIPFFYHVFELCETMIQTEGDFREVLRICIEYLSLMDRDEEEIVVQRILSKRESSIPEEQDYLLGDLDMEELKKIISANV